jgi:cytochrome c oxidase assembly protein subunit 15
LTRVLKPLSLVTAVITYIILLQGALVTNTGSGQGCGQNWPLCKGTWMPDWDYNAIIEFSHRAVSGVGGLLILALAVLVWQTGQSSRLKLLSVVSFLTVLFQGLLGAGNVLWPQPKWILALHFGISLICFTAVLLTAVGLRQAETPVQTAPIDPAFRRWTLTVMILFYGIVYLGAYVRHVGASLACMGFPDCNGTLFPGLAGPEGASFAHRVAALVGLLLIIRFTWMALKQPSPAIRRSGVAALVLVLAQIADGIAMALGHYNLLTQMLHSAFISALWGVLSVALMLAWDAAPVATGYHGRAIHS